MSAAAQTSHARRANVRSMTTATTPGVTLKMKNWTALYGQFSEAKAHLKELSVRPGAAVTKALKNDLGRLQRECGVALDQLQAEHAREKLAQIARMAR